MTPAIHRPLFATLVALALAVSLSGVALAAADPTAVTDGDDSDTAPVVIVEVSVTDWSQTSVLVGQPIAFRAQVSIYGRALSAAVIWRIDGTSVSCVSETGADGLATCTTLATLAPGRYTTTIISGSLLTDVTFRGVEHGVLVISGDAVPAPTGYASLTAF